MKSNNIGPFIGEEGKETLTCGGNRLSRLGLGSRIRHLRLCLRHLLAYNLRRVLEAAIEAMLMMRRRDLHLGRENI